MKVILFVLFFSAVILAETSPIEIPDGDPLAALLALFTNWSVWSPLAKAAGALILIVQAAKKFFPQFQHLRLLVTVLGIAWGTINAVINGRSLADALVYTLLISGGAIAVYNYFKKPINAISLIPRES